jgi:hypothetical protein
VKLPLMMGITSIRYDVMAIPERCPAGRKQAFENGPFSAGTASV